MLRTRRGVHAGGGRCVRLCYTRVLSLTPFMDLVNTLPPPCLVYHQLTQHNKLSSPPPPDPTQPHSFDLIDFPILLRRPPIPFLSSSLGEIKLWQNDSKPVYRAEAPNPITEGLVCVTQMTAVSFCI